MVKKGKNPQVMKHEDKENVYEANFKVFKTLSPVMTVTKSLEQKGEKGPEFVHYVPTVIERSKSITVYLRKEILSQVTYRTLKNPDASPSFTFSL